MTVRGIAFFIPIAALIFVFCAAPSPAYSGEPLRGAEDDTKMPDEVVEAKNWVKNEIKLNDSLIEAARDGKTREVALLIDRGADVNAFYTILVGARPGQTALMYAAASGHEETARLLLAKGADVNLANGDGLTALYNAANAGHTDIVRLLLSKKADPNARLEDGSCALIAAAKKGLTDIVAELARANARLDFTTRDGMTALMYISIKGYSQAADILLERGADVNLEDKKGRTALSYSVMYVAPEIEKKLADRKAVFGSATVEVLTGKQCGGCRKVVSILAELGDKCPHCAAVFGVPLETFKKAVTAAEASTTTAVAPDPSKFEGKLCKRCMNEVPYASKIGQKCPFCDSRWGTELIGAGQPPK